MKLIASEKPLSLYVHIPFCTRKCSYCAFYSLPRDKWPLSPDEYGAFILRKLDELSTLDFSTIYLGGGNPGLISDEMIIEIIKKASSAATEEITIEMNPEEITEERIKNLRPYITRLSVGIQSLNQDTLDTLGRNSSRKENIEALEILFKSGINYNADLITAVPGQKVEDTVSDIRELSEYNPAHISFYCLSFEENTPLYQMRGRRDENLEYDALLYGWKELEKLGYEHYEISNFARNNRYSMHNLNYWRLGQYIGLGPGSESSLGYERIFSYHEKEDIKSYLNGESSEIEALTGTEGVLEYLLASLRTKWGLDKKELLERFRVDFDTTFSKAVKELDDKCYINSENSFSLTEEGWMILDTIILSLSLAL